MRSGSAHVLRNAANGRHFWATRPLRQRCRPIRPCWIRPGAPCRLAIRYLFSAAAGDTLLFD